MSKEQSASSGSSDMENQEVEDIIQLISKRMKDFMHTKYSTDIHDYIPSLIVGFVSMALLLLTYQINSTSGYFGSGLRVPSHNVGIFVGKLISYRSFLMMLGFVFPYLIYYICIHFSIDEKARSLTIRIISLFFLYLLLATRGCLLFSSFLTNNLSYKVYILLSIESIPAGACQMSVFLLVPQFIFITFLSIHLLAFIFFLSQFIFDLFLSHKPLAIIRIQFFMSLVVTIVAFGLWAFYLFYYHDKEPKSYKDELYKQTNNIKKANSIYDNLNELAKKAIEIFNKLTTEFEDSGHLGDIRKELNVSKSIISDILILNTGFFILLKEWEISINKYKNNLEKLYIEINKKPDKDEKKDKNKFHSHKSKYYNDEFVNKVNQLNTLFENSYKKVNLTNLSKRLNDLENDIKDILKVFKNDGTKNSLEPIDEIQNLQNKIHAVYDEFSGVSFDFNPGSSNTHNINDLSIRTNVFEKQMDEKTKCFSDTISKYYNKIAEFKTEMKDIVELENLIVKILFDESDHIIFCYVMIAVACFFRDFLYPSIIPHALLMENEAQIILLLGIILQLFFCFPVFILDEFLNIFTLLIEKYFVYFWTLAGPPLIVLIFTFLAIHTKIRFFHVISESTGRVFTLSLFLIPFYTLMESVSYACVSHYVFNQLGFSHNNLLFLLFHQLLEMFCTYFFSKLSAGYNHARVRLGHCLPTYTTNYEMTFCQEFWSMVKWMLQYTFKDILFFFRTNIRQYL